jgi:endo-1,4-beta-xylanase
MNLRFLLVLGVLGLISLVPAGAMGAREPGGDRVLYSQGFETDTDGFTARGPNERLVLDGIPAHSGSHALTVTNRKSTWNGAIRDVSKVFRKGRTYKIVFWARYDEGPDYSAVNLSFQKSVDGAGDVFENAGSGQIPRGQWTKIEIEYSVPKETNVSSWKLYFETPYKSDSSVKASDLITFAIDDLEITQVPTVPKVVRKDIPAFQSFFPADMQIGTAIMPDHLNADNAHYDLLRHFNTFVYGNDMKQDATEPREGVFRFGPADALVKFAEARNVKLRGHTLLWHQQTPAWLFKDAEDPSKPATKDVLLARIEKHIKTLVGRYKGKFASWDVVNECIADDGSLRQSPYYKIVGSDEFIEKAFRWAHEADPDAKLVLNDYNTEYSGAKQEGFYREVKSLLDRGVPISAVGFQSHITLTRPSISDFKTVIERFAALGLDVQITELDISIYENGGEPRKAASRDLLTDQALRYANLFKLFVDEHKAGKLSTLLIWGMSDDETWLDNFPTPGRGDYPLLFDKNLQPKPAYWVVADPSKMPVLIQKTDAFQVAQAPAAANDDAWQLVSPKPLKDAQGKAVGWFKTVWTADALSVLVRVNQPQAAAGDAVTLYLDPQNSRSQKVPADAVKLTVPRDKGVSDADGYTVVASVPLAGKGKPMVKVGFDLKVTQGTQAVAWNDTTLGQDGTAENWGVLTLKPLPPLVNVTKGTPKVSGTPDPLWDKAVSVPIALESSGEAAPGSTVKLLWDENFLYALFEVKDTLLNDKSPNAYEQDSVELFLDQNNAKTTVYQPDDGQYRVNFKNVVTFNGGPQDGFKSATRLIPGGYRVVMAVPLTAVAGAEGVLYGFDVQVNNADGNGTRVGIRNWVDGSNQGYQNTSGWGLVRLVP